RSGARRRHSAPQGRRRSRHRLRQEPHSQPDADRPHRGNRRARLSRRDRGIAQALLGAPARSADRRATRRHDRRLAARARRRCPYRTRPRRRADGTCDPGRPRRVVRPSLVSRMTFPFRIQDIVDLSIIAFISYHVINLVRGTRTAQMLIGFLIVLATYLASQYFELHTLNWLLSNFMASIILVIVVIFQNDIRRALTQVGAGRSFSAQERVAQGQVLEEIVRSAVL